ncbi:hypothetical protein Tco_1563656 [Tanacetum coccineum]
MAMEKPRKSLNRPKGVRIKVQSPSSASDGAVLKRLHGCLKQVLDKMAYIKSVSEQMVCCEGVRDFDMKSSNAVKIGSNVKDSSMQMEDFNMVDSTLSTDNVSVHNVADVEHVDDAHVTEAELRHNFWQGH